MKLALDLQACQTPGSAERGIGRYSLEFAKAILRNRGEHDVHVLLNEAFPFSERYRAELDEAGAHASETYRLLRMVDVDGQRRLQRQNVNDHILNWRYARLHADVVHVSSIFEGWQWGDAHVTGRPGRIATTVRAATLYDLIPLIFADEYLSSAVKPLYLRRLEVFRNLDLIFTLSESARRDAMQNLQIPAERIVTIGAASSPTFNLLKQIDPREKSESFQRLGLEQRFILYTGGIDYRKNFDFLLEAYAALPASVRDDVQLVMVCALEAGQRRELLRRAGLLGVADRVALPGYISDNDLNLLCNTCELFVFPSLYEGFGLPVLEAMSCGACVIASARFEHAGNPRLPGGALRPPGRDRARSADPTLLAAPDRRRSLGAMNLVRSREFSWDRVGKTAIGAMEQAFSRASSGLGSATSSHGSTIA